MDRLLGIETEYGLFIEGVDIVDLADEARALVSSYPGHSAQPWDYGDEDPLRDARGWYASTLATNPEDKCYEKPTYQRRLTASEEHADRVLCNGARFYHDHGHPEYSTPECRSLRELIVHDKAGERIVWEAAQAYERKTGRSVSIFKNNIDYHGMSYGCHENYLVKRSLPFEQLIAGLMPFLVTRILFAGAGRVGSESDHEIDFQISQRADFFTELCSVDTLHRRPLINTRDEPHADALHYRRLHVICGDANLSEYATALKLGTTALVLAVLEAGYGAPGVLKDPVGTLRKLSRDPSRRWIVELEAYGTIPAIELQRLYLLSAQELFRGRDGETDWVLREWESVLEDLETDPRLCSDRVDWVAKYNLLQMFVVAERLDWRDKILCSADLEYHNVDREKGLFYELQGQGLVRRWACDRDIEQALEEPPQDTRASVRGFCVKSFHPLILALNWGQIRLRDGHEDLQIDLRCCVDGRIGDMAQKIAAVSTPRELWRMIREL